MKKPANLRDTLIKKVAYLGENPDRLYTFIDGGAIVATGARSQSYEYQYNLNIIIDDYPGDQNVLMAVIIGWIEQHQPDIFLNSDKRQSHFTFDAFIDSNQTASISIDLKLTERVLVNVQADKLVVGAVEEPVDPFESWESVAHER
ncbi:phage tail protein [Proteus sp. G2639]|nr:phage tail protein [Proteus mirabilis]NBN60821.1 phage tail protein [Proteus sp. G2639]